MSGLVRVSRREFRNFVLPVNRWSQKHDAQGKGLARFYKVAPDLSGPIELHQRARKKSRLGISLYEALERRRVLMAGHIRFRALTETLEDPTFDPYDYMNDRESEDPDTLELRDMIIGRGAADDQKVFVPKYGDKQATALSALAALNNRNIEGYFELVGELGVDLDLGGVFIPEEIRGKLE
ncbi:MAG: hypothetical protein HQ564_09180 [Candidatus Saganbacteria bacterium]|nr:hypothetical protein [Candidatus Saganbacteria bacterium]